MEGFCKCHTFRNFREGSYFPQRFSEIWGMNFHEKKISQNGDTTLPFTGVGKSCSSHEFLTWEISFNAIRDKIFYRNNSE